MKEYKTYLAEQESAKAEMQEIANFINGKVPAKIKHLVKAGATKTIGDWGVRIDINANLGEKGRANGGAEHFNGRLALFTLDKDKNAFEYLSGEVKRMGFRPLQARKQKTSKIAAEKFVAWLEKNADKILTFVEEHTDENGKFKMY